MMHRAGCWQGVAVVLGFLALTAPYAIAQRLAFIGRAPLKDHRELMRERATFFLGEGIKPGEVDTGLLHDIELLMVKFVPDKQHRTSRTEMGCCVLTNLKDKFYDYLSEPHSDNLVVARHYMVTQSRGWPQETELAAGTTPDTFLYQNGYEFYRQENGQPSYLGSSSHGPRGQIEVAHANTEDGYQVFELKFGEQLENVSSLRVPRHKWPKDWMDDALLKQIEEDHQGVWQQVRDRELLRTVTWMRAEQSRAQEEMDLLRHILELSGREY